MDRQKANQERDRHPSGAIYGYNNTLTWYPGKGDGSFWSGRELGTANFRLMAL